MKPFTTIASVLFAVFALVHLLRMFFGWEVTINGSEIPVWVSGAVVVVAAALSWMLCREARRKV